MDITKRLYLIACSIFLYLLIGCIYETLKKRSRLAFAVCSIDVGAFISILFFCSYIDAHSETLALIFGLSYMSMLGLAILSMMHLVYVMEEKQALTKKDYFHIILFCVLVLMDIIQLFAFGIADSTIRKIVYREGFRCYRITLNSVSYLVHKIICYTTAVFVIYKLITDCRKASTFYKPKFVVMFFLFVVVVTINGCYFTLFDLMKLDYSLIVYGFEAVFTFLFIMRLVPRQVKNHMLAIANESISDAVICFDNKENCLYTNAMARKLYRGINTYWIQDFIYNPEDFARSTVAIEVDNEDHIFNLEFRRIRDKNGRYAGSYFKLSDRTIEIKNIEKEEYRASHDELTGLYNRNQFFTEAEKTLKAYGKVPYIFACTDISNFKLINDLFGQKFGDMLLLRQAEMLSKANFPGVVRGRLSGDKFGLLIPKERFNPEKAIINTDQIRDIAKNINFQFKVLIGVYEIENNFENVHSMYDKAILAIKNIPVGSNQIIGYYDTSLMQKLILEKNIISEFKHAIQNYQFFMFLQSQIDVKTGKCVGAEALVRWYDIDRGYRQPGEFISVLENAGLIYQLDYYIWEKAVQTLSKWDKEGYKDKYISVNISARDFYSADLYKVFTGLVEKYNVLPKNLNLEITESVLIDNQKYHKTVLAHLQEYGFRIEMDDFGSGYSSLNILKEISMDVLKIDMGFLRRSENEERGRLIIHSIVKMAHSLGMEVICEGVENEDQKNYLSELGVDVFQGYFYSKPIPLQEFEHKYLEVLK